MGKNKRNLRFHDANSNDIRGDVLFSHSNIIKAPQPGRAWKGQIKNNSINYTTVREVANMRSRKDMTSSDIEYIAKFYKFDGAYGIAAALDMAAQDIRNVYSQMNKNGQLNTLRKLEACYVGVR